MTALTAPAVLDLFRKVTEQLTEQYGPDYRYSDRYPADSNVCSYVAPPSEINPDWLDRVGPPDDPHEPADDDPVKYRKTGPPECACAVARMFDRNGPAGEQWGVDEEALGGWIAMSTIWQSHDRPLGMPDLTRGALDLLVMIQNNQDLDRTYREILADAERDLDIYAHGDDKEFHFRGEAPACPT